MTIAQKIPLKYLALKKFSTIFALYLRCCFKSFILNLQTDPGDLWACFHISGICCQTFSGRREYSISYWVLSSLNYPASITKQKHISLPTVGLICIFQTRSTRQVCCILYRMYASLAIFLENSSFTKILPLIRKINQNSVNREVMNKVFPYILMLI